MNSTTKPTTMEEKNEGRRVIMFKEMLEKVHLSTIYVPTMNKIADLLGTEVARKIIEKAADKRIKYDEDSYDVTEASLYMIAVNYLFELIDDTTVEYISDIDITKLDTDDFYTVAHEIASQITKSMFRIPKRFENEFVSSAVEIQMVAAAIKDRNVIKQWKKLVRAVEKGIRKFSSLHNMMAAFIAEIEARMYDARNISRMCKLGQRPKYAVRWLDAYIMHIDSEPEDVIEWELHKRNRMVAAEWFANWKQVLTQSHVNGVIGLLYTEDAIHDYFYADIHSYIDGTALVADGTEFHLEHTECFIKTSKIPSLAIVKLYEICPEYHEVDRITRYIEILLQKGMKIYGITANNELIEIKSTDVVNSFEGSDHE